MIHPRSFSYVLCTAALSFASALSSFGQWNDHAANTSVCAAADTQAAPVITTDGADGCIIAWSDRRSHVLRMVYAQRIASDGARQWMVDGIPLDTVASDQLNPQLCPDDSGGAIVVWVDYRGGPPSIFAQRISPSGGLLWGAAGVAVKPPDDSVLNEGPTIVRDGAGGAIVAWRSASAGLGNAIRAQRINAGGVLQWPWEGALVSHPTAGGPGMVSDEAGGSILVWQDTRSDPHGELYAQRLDGSGSELWTSNGVRISSFSGSLTPPFWEQQLCSDGTGGAIVVFIGPQTGDDNHFYAQRVNAAGSTPWTLPSNGGINVGYAFGSFYSTPGCTSDGSHGAIICAHEITTGVEGQRIDSSGNRLWNGGQTIAVSNYYCGGGAEANPAIVGDGAGGAIIAWNRNCTATNADIYAQDVDSKGNLLWAKYGQVVTFAPHDQLYPTMVRSGTGGAIVAWTDMRNAPSRVPDIFCDLVYALSRIYIFTGAEIHSFDNTGILIDLKHLNGFAYGLQVKVVKYPNPPDPPPPFNTEHIIGIGQNAYWTIDAMDTPPPGANFSADITFSFSAAELPTGPLQDIRIATRDGPTGTLDLPSLGEVHPEPKSIAVQGVDHFSEWALCTVPEGTTQFAVSDRWNMISVPLVVADYTKDTLYPTSVSNAFAYQSGYTVEPILANGAGYWLKFSGAQSIPINGSELHSLSLAVTQGWNMIGTIDQPLPVSQVMSDTAGLTTSQFFGYHGIYQVADTLQPGTGYWVKANQAGRLILSGSASASPRNAHKIRVVQTPELPPPPPGTESSTPKPVTFGLEQNFPNPFNPLTVIRYQLSVQSRVRLTIYDALGREVTTLVDQFQEAGFRSVRWDASSVASGVYSYKLEAEAQDRSQRFVDTRKMLVIK
jgi:hypothetical protein